MIDTANTTGVVNRLETALRCRERAEDLRAIASCIQHGEARDVLLLTADEYEEMASLIDGNNASMTVH